VSDEWPTHLAELSRKTSTQVSKWASAYDAGSITKREFYLVITALYDATSGLIARDLSDVIAATKDELRGIVPVKRKA
jgi:hypothetical protein